MIVDNNDWSFECLTAASCSKALWDSITSIPFVKDAKGYKEGSEEAPFFGIWTALIMADT